MEQPMGPPCPQCGAPRRPDNTPSCACTRRASDARRDTREAQAAAAEDFDALRIRPYVELDDASDAAWDAHFEPSAAPAHAPAPEDTPKPSPTEPATADLRLFDASEPNASEPNPSEPNPSESDSPELNLSEPNPTGPHATDPEATRLTPITTAPSAPAPPTPEFDEPPTPPRRRRRAALLAASGAVVAVVAASGYASGLFSYEKPSRDTALPDDIRASVPDTETTPPSTPPATNTPSAPPQAPASPTSPPTSASPSPSLNPSTSPSSTSPAPTRSAVPTPTPTAPEATGSMEASDHGRERTSRVLRRGDKGPEVTELQLRLRQLYLYNGDINDEFTSQVEDALRNYQEARGIHGDDLGVYGQETRTRLESETSEP
ncbi:peptidoglycan-binding protein [Streptomyces sp. TRM68367]|uniref:peptidoglycan-binding domain-containing protein n=1 Tax=Streptomyces sp. TRM68367 TaxID=2758415 RepID=UPI00165BDE3D|nr:peptidoglycan-binding protein [Streptomyces sp. TRM68367]MBC9724088.1 peptidoglycan-binding protein [Streptomyces sp. TRM68367]